MPAARLLLVDNDEAARDFFGRRLLRSGYHVDTAEEGFQALEMAASHPYDLILLDHMMPGISGMESMFMW